MMVNSGGRHVRRALGWAFAGSLAVCGGALAVGGGAAAAQPIHACFNKQTGTLHVISGGGHCRHNEGDVTWGVKGPKGPKGAIGRRGPQGSEGAFGANGATGATGFPGAVVIGVTGATGPTGAAGATGSTGATGPNGAKGVTGATGPAGTTGAVGATGAGSAGPAGAAGETGATGGPGATGPAGPALPAPLASGHSETGVWMAASPEKPEVPSHFTLGIISFPVALKSPIGETKVVFVKQAETAKPAVERAPAAAEHCTGTLEAPTASSGYLCVYTGVEELQNAEFHGIEKNENTPGTNRQGAAVMFEVLTVEGEAHARAQGTWAVTG
jgi:hypothetical protein